MKYSFSRFILAAGLFLAAVQAVPGATISVSSSTSWSALTGGSGPGGLPNATDTVVVQGGATLTVNVANGQCGSLQLGGTAFLSGNGTLTFQAGSQLTCATNVTVGNSTRTGSLNFTAGGLLQVAGAITVTALGTFTAGAGTIEYNGSGAQTVVSTLGAYNNLRVSGGNTKTLGGTITVNGDLTIGSGTTLSVSGSNYAIALAGNWINNGGTFSAGSGIVRINGAGAQSIGGSASTTFSRLTINKGGDTATADVDFTVSTVFTNLAGTFNASSRTITLSGSGTPLVISGGTFNPSTSTIAYTSTSGATIAGGLTYYNLSTVGNSGGDTFTAGNNFTVANVMTVGQGTFNGGSVTIAFSGAGTPFVISGGTFTPATSTISYTSGSGATITATTYNNLTINGTGTFDLGGATTVSATLSLASGALSIGANTLTLNGAISATGGTLVGGLSSDITFGGSGASTTLPAVTLHDLTVNRANGVAIASGVTVNGTLTLTAGAVTGGSNLALGNGATISRQGGNLAAAPAFGASVNVVYTGSTSTATGPEIPTSTTVLNNFSDNNTGTITLTNALYVNGNLSIATSANLDVSTSNFGITVGGNWTNTGSGTLTARAGTVTFNGAADQYIGGATTPFNSLTVNKSGGTLNLAVSTTVGGTLTLTAGTLTVNGFTLTLNGPAIAGTPSNLITSSASTLVFGGTSADVNVPSSVTALSGLTINNANGVTLNSSPTLGGTLTLTSGALSIGANTLTLNGLVTRTGGTLTGGASANIIFGGAGATTSLPAVTLNDLTINRANGISLSGAVTVDGTLTLTSGALSLGANTLTLNGPISTGSGTLTGGATSDLIVGGNGASTTLPAVASGLRTLTLNRANGLTLGGAVTVSTRLTLTDGQLGNGANLTLGNNATIVRATGNLAATPTFGTSVNVSYTGATGITTGLEIPAGATVLNNLTNNNSGGVTLGGNVNVNGRLALNSILTTGANQVGLAAAAVVSGAGAGSYVNGYLRRAFNTGAGQSFTFAVGDGASYAPINLASLNVTTAGSLTARATAGDHPQIAASGISSAKSVNRYWTLTNSPNGIVIATNTARFNFIGVGTDVDAGADTSTFMVQRYDGAWSTNTVGSWSPTNTLALNVTAFGDFAIGNAGSNGPASFTTNTVFFNYTNRAAFLAAGWDFIARTTNGTARNTETTVGTSPPDVAYARTNADLGTVLRVPVDTGDLWAAANNTRNSLFRDLSPDWQSVRLQLSFAPTQPFQQVQLALYQNDNNYVEVGYVYTYPTNPAVTFGMETNGVPRELEVTEVTLTNFFLRLDRDLSYGLITAFYSPDGTNWVSMGHADQDLVSPRLAIWVGGSPNGFPSADLHRLDIVTSDTPVLTTLDFQRPTYVFSAVAGQACTNLQRARVIHRGPAGLHWNLTNTASWLLTSVTSGDAATAFDLSVDTTGLAAGVYETGLKFGAPGAANTPATLNVKLIVNPDVRARASTWRGGKGSAMTVWVDDSSSAMFNILQANGFAGTYLLWGVDATHLIPSYFTNFYNAGMELGAHTVHHLCNEVQDELTLRSEIETNIADILKFTPAQQQEVICFAFPCGLAGVRQKASAADYFLATRGYNVNQLEDPSPYDWMFLKCYNSHENDPAPYNPSAPPNPSDFKTVVDAAIAQGKWANLVFHGLNNDDGAVAYSVGKDIWVNTGGAVTKYILQRDRTVISNYVETAGQIRFDSYRLPLESSIYRDFESALTTNDLLTFQVDISGLPAVTNVTIAGVATTNYSMRSVGGKTLLFLDTQVTGTAKRIALGVSNVTNYPPVLATNANVVINEGQTLNITNSATDPNTNALTFTLAANAPSGMTITTNGILNWTPGETAGGSNFTVTVIVTDNGLPALSASNSFTVTVNELNTAPALPAQSDRFLISQTPLTVINTATDIDIPVNALGYTLLVGPTNASISASGVITWTPSVSQVPSTNTFTTVVTDTNITAVNSQNLSATNTFVVTVSATPLTLPAQTNRTINEFTTLLVTNTASDPEISSPANVGQLVTNTIYFTYTNRAALLADGWDFMARMTNGSPRNTEQTSGAVVSYDQSLHPGALRVPVDVGDLWQFLNSTRNSLFRDLASNWLSMRLNVSLTPTQNYQQVHLALYQDDDNWVHTGLAYNSGYGGTIVPIVRELNGVPDPIDLFVGSVTNIHMRLDRNPANGNITAFYSLDNTNWTTVGTRGQSFANPRLALWTGGSPSGFPNADYRRLDVVVTNAPKRLTYFLLNPPAGAQIDTNGVISWTPNELQGPGTNVITTVVTDNGYPALFTTNSFTVFVNELNASPALNLPGNTNIPPLSAWSALATATDSDVPTNTWAFALVSGPSGLTVSPNGLISWTPNQLQGGTTNTVLVSVTDTNPPAVNTISLSTTGSFQIVVSSVLTITPDNQSRAYGAANPTFTGSLVGLQPGDNITATYSSTATTSSPIGSYPIVAALNDPDGKLANYSVVTNTGTLTILPAGLTVTANATNKVFGNPDPALTYLITAGALVNGDNLGGSLTRAAGESVGSYAILQGTLSATTNYALSYVGANLTITKSNAPVTLNSLSQTYDGTAKNASATTVPAGLTVNLTYNGSANAPTNAGSYEVIGTVAEANYMGTATNTLVIAPSNAPVSLGDLSHVFDGSAKSASATTVPAGLTVNLTYNGSANAPTNAGSYTVIGIIADSNYAGSATNTFTIAQSNAPVTLNNLSQTYDGTAKNASATTVPAGLTVNLTYNGSANAPTNAGSYEVIGTIAEVNYAGSATNTLVIAPSNAPVTLGDLSHVYDGTAKNAGATTVPAGLTVNLTYNGGASAPTNAGSYEVIGTIADPNYAGSATNTLVIAPSNAPVTLGDLSQVYDGTGKNASATTVPAALTVNLTYSGSANAPTNAGSYEVIGTIAEANYVGSATNTLTITPSNAPVTLGDLSHVYDGTAKSASATTVLAGLTINLTYNGSADAPTNAGSYEVIGTIAEANYIGSATNTLIISQSNVVVTLNDLSHVYDGTGKVATAITTPSGLAVNLTYDGSANAPTNAGSYTVIGTVAEANYSGAATNTLTIAPSNTVVTLGDLNHVYDGVGKSATATTVPAGLTVNFTYNGDANAPTNAGSYTVIGTIADSNYAGSATNTLTIVQSNAPVTLGDLSHLYDGLAKNASATTVPAGLNVTLTYNGSANAPTNAGSYEVIGTIADSNYAGSATNTLTIAPSNAPVTLGNLSQVYDGTAKNVSVTTLPSGLTVNLTYDGSSNAPTNVGSYTVVGTIAELNYTGAATNTLIIAYSNAVVTLSNLSHVFDGTARSATATTEPLGLTVNLTYDGSSSAPTNAGSYTVIGTIADVNYAGATTNTLVIAKSNAPVSLGDLSHVYDGTGKSASATTVPTGLTVHFTYDGNANAPTNAGSYTVIGTIADSNYAGSATNTLTIAQSNAPVTLGDLSHVYDGTARNASATTAPAGLTVNLTYNGSADAPTNVGSYEVIGTIAEANYVGSATNTFIITPSNAPVTLGELSHVYDGTAKSASATTVPAGLTVSLTYDGSANAPTNAGSYEVVGTVAEANYSGVATNTLVIAPSNAPVTLGDLSHTYDGTGKAATATTVPPGLNVTLTYNGNTTLPTNAGSYNVIGTIADSNYAGSATNTLTIAQSNAPVTLGDLSHVYDGTAKNASATTVPAGLTVNLTYNGSADAPTNAGSYEVIGTVAEANYSGSATNTLVIAVSNALVTLGDLSHVYDGAGKSATATSVPAGLTVNLTYNGSADAPTNAGSYEVIGTIAEVNYTGSATNTLVIALSNAPVTLGDLSHVYDGTAKNASATTVPAGLTVNLTYNGSANAPTNAGSYEVIGTVAEANYSGSATNTLVIAPSNAPVTLGDLSHTYDGTAKNASATTVPAGLTVNLTYNGSASAPTNAGSYTVIGIIADSNYAGSATNTLTIAQSNAPVTLGDLSHVYDGSAKTASATTVPAGLSVTLTYNGGASAPTNAGSYEVIGTIADPNYAGSATNTLTIAQSNAPVTLNNLSQTYDGTAKSASATTVPAGLTVNLTYNGSANAPTNAGSYEVIGTIADSNYAGSATNTLVIAPSNAPVTLGDLSHVYDGTAKNASATTVPAGLTVNLTYNGSANAPTNVGSYEVVATIVEANYTGSATNTMVIQAAATPFPITAIEVVNDTATITWSSTVSRTYRLQYKDNVNDANWIDVVPDVVAAGASASQTNAVVGVPQRFYQVILLP